MFSFAASVMAERHNILLIVADDFATDGIRRYNTNQVTFPPMPNLERLAQSGVTFRNAYGYPTCSPSRCSILTGRYGFRTGIGFALATPNGPSLQSSEFTIPEALTAAGSGVRHGMVGKWHLSFAPTDPNALGGFGDFSGGLLGEVLQYDNWPIKVTNGVALTNYTQYATTDNLRDATNWISLQGTNSWFLWLAFNACHEPFHKPPNDQHSYDYLSGTRRDIETNSRPYYEAMAESMDHATGKLLDFLGDQTNHTTVIWLGDNGTPNSVLQPPFPAGRGKASLYEGGIRVPLIVSGPKVAGHNRYSDALVSLADLYPTILELANVNLATTLPANLTFDGRSFLSILTNTNYSPTERFVLSENFAASIPNDVAGRAVRNGRFKLIRFDTGVEEMYDLAVDPYEGTNLLARSLSLPQQTNYVALTTQLREWDPTPQPQVTGFGMLANRFAVTVTHTNNVRCQLWRSENLAYPVWTVLTNATTLSLSSTNTRLADTSLPPNGAFYRVTAIPAASSTNFVGVWKPWD